MTLARILRHRWHDETDAAAVLTPEVLDRLEARIAASERLHSGEIRVCVESSLPWNYLLRDTPARDRAIALFGTLRVWDTEHHNGVLLYVLLADHAIEIVADRGLNRWIDRDAWVSVIDAMRADFRAGLHEAGLMRAIDRIDALMIERYPLAKGQTNPDELPNRPVLL